MENNNDVLQEILNAIDTRIRIKLEELEYDYTIKGVVQQVNSDSCVVTIDGENSVCKTRAGVSVAIGDLVNLVVPKGNYSQKYIDSKLGLANTSDTGTGGGTTLTGSDIVTLINGSTSIIDDDNLSTNVNDALTKRHGHINSLVLDAIEEAFTTILKTKLDSISDGATKTEASTTNGNIVIDGVENTVYTHPSGTNPHGTTKEDVGLGNVTNDAQVKRTEMGVANGVATLDINGVNAQSPKAHNHVKSEITDMPTKLSEFTNDIGAGGGIVITVSPTEPTVSNVGDFWYKEL